MPTFKVVILPHQKRNDGTYNVKVRVIQDRVSKFIRTVSLQIFLNAKIMEGNE